MKKKLKSTRGITLVSLTIAVVILLILTSMIVYNAKDGIEIQRLKQLNNDISNLRDKTTNYYNEYGKIPANIEYTNIDHLGGILNAQEKETDSKFYVIDLQTLQGLTLNYGNEYEEVKNRDMSTANNYTDLYIINEKTLNIFYVKGIEIKSVGMRYTDYDTPTDQTIQFRYVEGVKIPEGFYYIGGTKDTGIVISDNQEDNMQNTESGNQFVWVPVENVEEIYNKTERKGKLYNFSQEGDNIRADLKLDDTTTGTGEREPAYLADATTGDNSTSNTGGITQESLQQEYREMMRSVEKYKGFFVARYETSLNESGHAQSKARILPMQGGTTENNKWYTFYQKQKDFASTTNNSELLSSMIAGSQYDAMLNWMGKGTDKLKIVLKTNATHTGLEPTASNEKDKINNIYDLEGNLAEWTLEASGTNSRIKRGGNYSLAGAAAPNDRNIDYPTNSNTLNGSRMVLYLTARTSLKTDSDGIYKQNSTIDGDNEGTYDNPMIPKGFKPVNQGEAIWIEGSNQENVDKGLVIQDKEENQFVWIPVDGSDIKLSRYTFDSSGVETDQGRTIINSYYEESANSTYGNTVAKDIEKFKTSVSTYGGYYVGRYEASNHSGKVASKSASVWNGIVQPDAATACKNMYNSTYGVTSDLMNSYAWDTTLVFIQKYGQSNYSVQTPLQTNLMNTGTTGDIKCNIYDMAGNVKEWTTETYNISANPCVNRGGYYDNNLYNTSYREYSSTGNNDTFIGFRPILYL